MFKFSHNLLQKEKNSKFTKKFCQNSKMKTNQKHFLQLSNNDQLAKPFILA